MSANNRGSILRGCAHFVRSVPLCCLVMPTCGLAERGERDEDHAATPAPAAADPDETEPAPAVPREPAPAERREPRELGQGCRDLSPAPSASASVFIDARDPRAQGFDVSNAQGDVPWRTLALAGL